METASESITIQYNCTAKEVAEGVALMIAPTLDASAPAKKSKSRDRDTFLGRVLLWLTLSVLLFTLVRDQWMIQSADPAGGTSRVAFSRSLLTGLMLTGIGALTLAWFMHRRATGLRKACWSVGSHMIFSPAGVAESGRGVQTCFGWTYFRSVDESTRIIILRTMRSRAFIIPKRLFGDDADLRPAIALARLYTTKPALSADVGFEVVR